MSCCSAIRVYPLGNDFSISAFHFFAMAGSVYGLKASETELTSTTSCKPKAYKPISSPPGIEPGSFLGTVECLRRYLAS